jgi:hypothetical protein
MKLVYRSRWMGWAAGLAMVAGTVSIAGAQQDDHGRKWKPLPPLAHIVVTVMKGFDGRPLPNAAVVFHSTMNGRDNGNLEVKTDPDGKATIDLIEVGSDVDVQVIATGFATYAQDLNQVGASKVLEVKLLRPREQVSMYRDSSGKAAEVKPGIQEPPRPITPTAQPAGDQPLAPPPTPQTPQTPKNPPTSNPQ